MSTHNTFLLRNKKDISIFRMKKAPYLLLCCGYSQEVTCQKASSDEHYNKYFVEKQEKYQGSWRFFLNQKV